MRKLKFEIAIAAPPSRVWRALTDPDCFRGWAGEFAPGSRVEGRWRIGEEIRFLTPDGSGMLTRIRALEQDRHLEFEVVGVVVDGKAALGTDDARAWRGGRESYRLEDTGGGCRLRVGVDVPDANRKSMQDAWPRALAALRGLAEAGPQPGPGPGH